MVFSQPFTDVSEIISVRIWPRESKTDWLRRNIEARDRGLGTRKNSYMIRLAIAKFLELSVAQIKMIATRRSTVDSVTQFWFDSPYRSFRDWLAFDASWGLLHSLRSSTVFHLMISVSPAVYPGISRRTSGGGGQISSDSWQTTEDKIYRSLVIYNHEDIRLNSRRQV